MIVSFNYTQEPYRKRIKTVTRRFWLDSTVKKFKIDSVHQGWTASPHRGGELMHSFRVVSIRRESLDQLMTRPEYASVELIKEGDLWPDLATFLALLRKNTRVREMHPVRMAFEHLTTIEKPDHHVRNVC